jgi:3-phosphoshikimate 1-carboxyvinyltransferase
MAFLVLGMASERPIGIDDGQTINTSFPGFVALMNGLGAAIHPGAP